MARMKDIETNERESNGRGPKAVVTSGRAPNALSETDRAALLETDAGAGFEDVRPSDLTLPQFKLLQSMSPETKRTETAYVRGGREGLWLDVITRRLFSELTFVPCKYATHYVEWARETRGRLIANHGVDRTLYDRCTRDEAAREMVTPSGRTVIVETATWYGIVIGGREIDPNVIDDKGSDVELRSRAVITMSGTGKKVAARWISDASSIRRQRSDGSFYTPALYAMTYAIASAPNKNDRGSWYLPVIDRAGWTLDYPNGAEIFKAAQAFYEFARDQHEALVRAATPSDDVEPAPSNARRADQRRPDASEDLEDVPF